MTLINNSRQPQMLDDGTILAAHGTDGYTREVESISDADRKRLVDRGIVAIAEPKEKQSAKKEAK